MKKCISLFLSLVLLFACTVPLFRNISLTQSVAQAAENKVCNCGVSPIIYIHGKTEVYKDPVNRTGRMMEGINDYSVVVEAVKDCLPSLVKAITLDDWDEYTQKLMVYIDKMTDGYTPNEDGTVTNGSGTTFSWSEKSLSTAHNKVDNFIYRYDPRISPMEVADDLNDYIEAVKRKTGHSKVTILCRCLGVNIAMAYLQKYQEPVHYEGIDKLVMYAGTLWGVDSIEAALTGNIHLDAESASLFLNDFEYDTDNEFLGEYLALTLKMLEETYGMELTTDFLNSLYARAKDTVFVQADKKLFALCPSWWSMVYNNYEQGKKYIFGDETERYAALIAKIDDFHYNVQMRAEYMFEDMKKNGVEIDNIISTAIISIPFQATVLFAVTIPLM